MNFIPKDKQCKVDNCSLAISAKGWCKSHYISNYNKSYIRPVSLLDCTVEGCARKRKRQRYCSMHSERLRKYGDLTFTKLPRHGFSGHILYGIWIGMIKRCYNAESLDYKNYGGRGIIVCKTWLDSFNNFSEDMGDRPKGTSLDRIDNDGNYEPGNCRWANRTIQNYNKRSLSKTGYKNIYLTKDKHFSVSMDKNHKRFYGGKFTDIDDAINQVGKLHLKLYGGSLHE